MKRGITLLLCLAFALAALTACSASVDNSKTDTDVADTAKTTEFKVGETWTVDGQWE